jgi:hypothetical protein
MFIARIELSRQKRGRAPTLPGGERWGKLRRASHQHGLGFDKRGMCLSITPMSCDAHSRKTRGKYPFDIAAIVVLPDHLHAVWTLPLDDADFSTRWRLIKTRFAKSLPKQERRSAVREARNERGIWQRRFWEHLVRDDADYEIGRASCRERV